MDKYTKLLLANDIINEYYGEKRNIPSFDDFIILIDVDNKVQESLNDALLIAVEHEPQSVRVLLENGADSNVAYTIGGMTPLLIALDKPYHKHIVKLLLAFSANVEKCDDDGRNAIMYAAQDGLYLEILLDSKINFNLDLQDNNGFTALMFAVFKGQPINVEKLLRYDMNIDIQTYEDGCTALTLAVKENHEASVETFLAYGANTNLQQKDGCTALMIAINRDKPLYVEMLLKYGANPNIQKKNNGCTALMIILCDHGLQFLEILLDHGANPNIRDNMGKTPLMCAASYCPNSLKSLLACKGVDVEIRDVRGITALMIAAQTNMECVKLLLEADDNIDTQDNMGNTALLYAARFNLQCAKVLITSGANVEIRGNDGKDLLDIVSTSELFEDKTRLDIAFPLFPAIFDQETSVRLLAMMMNVKHISEEIKVLIQRIVQNDNLDLSGFHLKAYYEKHVLYIFLRYVSNLHGPTKKFGKLNQILVHTKTERQAISLEEHEYKHQLLEKFDKRIKSLCEELETCKKNAFDPNHICRRGTTFFMKNLRHGNINILKALLTCPGFDIFILDYNLMTAIDHLDRILVEDLHYRRNTKSFVNTIVDSDIYKHALRSSTPWFSKSNTIPCSNGRYPMLDVIIDGKRHCYANPYVDAKRSLDLRDHFLLKINETITIILPMKTCMYNMRNRVFSILEIPYNFKNDGTLSRLIPYMG